MAEPYDTLMQVQDHDTALDQLQRRIEAMPERIALAGVRERQGALRVAIAAVQAEVDELADRQAALEERIAASAKRRHELEARMRSGSVTASKDLQAMDHEVSQLAERQRTLEDEELVLMEEEEPLDKALTTHRVSAGELEAEAARLSEAAAVSEVELQAAIESETAARVEAATGLPAELSERYERLRSHLGGIGAARLVGDRCDGCHLTLPSVEIERIHHLSAETFATCPQCDRILVH
jgi:predicted  nucleic acid-binding Zn-ribbon protein